MGIAISNRNHRCDFGALSTWVVEVDVAYATTARVSRVTPHDLPELILNDLGGWLQ